MPTTLPSPAGDATWSFQVPPTIFAELEEFQSRLDQFRAGALNETQFRALRVPRGVYEQRESGTYMLRVRFPAGGIRPPHLHRLADVATTWGNGVLHVTTRQEFQIHRVPLDSIVPALRALAEAGLSTKGGGGNTVRNVTACLDAGVCRDELFDVAPYAIATTERLLADPLSLQLPRKYKVAFAGCDRDCSGANVHDVGFIARVRDGVPGFAVYVGGGMGGRSRIGSLLHEFIPATDAWLVAESVKRVFDRHGDRKNKHLARLRFLVERLGLEEFQRLYATERATLESQHPAPLEVRPWPRRQLPAENGGTAAHLPSTPSPDDLHWQQRNVRAQKQSGLYQIHIPLALGDLPAPAAVGLAELIATHGEGTLRATPSQNLILRDVTEAELPVLRQRLAQLGLAHPDAPLLRNLVACAGASTCRLGICLSRGLAKAIRTELTPVDDRLDDAGELTVHISGCPNSCGRHPIGNLGFSGAARKIDGELVPFYAVQVGGRVGEGRTRFGTNVGALPARNVPAFVRDLLDAWQSSSDRHDFHQFLDHDGRRVAAELVARHQSVPPGAHRREYYFDWDATERFSLAGRGAGECSAGVFDLIEVDLANARESLEAGRLYAATLAASHALLVTRGAEAKSDPEVFAKFQRHFVEEGWVESTLGRLIEAGRLAAESPTPAETFAGTLADVTALVAAVRLLHESLDASLRFKHEPAALPRR